MMKSISFIMALLLLYACSQNPYRAKVVYEGLDITKPIPVDVPIEESATEPNEIGLSEPKFEKDDTTELKIEEDKGTTELHSIESVYIVKSGDTVYSIARAHSSTPEELRTINNLDKDFTIHPGDELMIKGGEAHTNDSIQSKPVIARARESKSDFIQPVAGGRIISSYGDKQDSDNKSGILIAAQDSTVVSAVADGMVIFAGNELRSYGNMVLIEHSNNIISAYAYLGDISVTEEQKIYQGQEIGKIAKQPPHRILLQIRVKGKPVNPGKYLDL